MNDEIRTTKAVTRHWTFVIRHLFVIRVSSFWFSSPGF